MPRYYVITTNEEEQQAHFDIIEARDQEAALGIVLNVRDYCDWGTALTADDLRDMARELDEITPEDIDSHWDETVQWHIVDETA